MWCSLNGQPWGYSEQEERLCLLGVGEGGAGTARDGSGGKKWVISQKTMPAVSLLSTSIYVSKAQDGAHRSAFLLESVYHALE